MFTLEVLVCASSGGKPDSPRGHRGNSEPIGNG